MPKEKRVNRKQGKCWAFTVYDVEKPIEWGVTVAYGIYSLEAGSATEHEHFQGYVRMKNRGDMRAAQAAIGRPTAHVEKAIGTEEENHDYCSKPNTHKAGPWETGTYDPHQNSQGHRTDLDEVAHTIMEEHLNIRQVAAMDPSLYCRYRGGLEKIVELFAEEPPISRPVKLTILWGPPRTGKSYRVYHAFKPSELCKANNQHPFDAWDSTHHKVLFFDEFDPVYWHVTDFNRLVDQWTYTVPCRYHDKQATWEQVVICTNKDPMTWFLNADPVQLAAFRARISGHVIEVKTQEEKIDL